MSSGCTSPYATVQKKQKKKLSQVAIWCRSGACTLPSSLLDRCPSCRWIAARNYRGSHILFPFIVAASRVILVFPTPGILERIAVFFHIILERIASMRRDCVGDRKIEAESHIGVRPWAVLRAGPNIFRPSIPAGWVGLPTAVWGGFFSFPFFS